MHKTGFLFILSLSNNYDFSRDIKKRRRKKIQRLFFEILKFINF